MKPPPFTYHAPSSLPEALDVLAEVGAEGKVLAGGQSLVPLLSMRLAEPAHLVDVNRLGGELGGISVDARKVRVGALARHADVERHADAHRVVPLLRQALRNVAHPAVRNRGTTVGSLVHADPSAEMPAVLCLLGGGVELAHRAGRRTVAATDFFTGPLESALAPGELALAATFPAPPPRTGTAFAEVARRHGDYAVCGVAAAVTLDPDGRIHTARAAYLSVGPTPVVLDLTGPLAGQRPEAADWSAAGALARASVEPDDDIHATADYRAHLAGVLTTRVLRAAAAQTPDDHRSTRP